MPLMSRHGNMVGQDKDVGAEGNRPWHALLRVGRAAFRRCGNPGLMGGSLIVRTTGARVLVQNG
jgi:hypothetical protein